VSAMLEQPVPRPPRPRQSAKVPNAPKRSYDLPRWRDEGRLGNKDFVRKATEVSSGRQGIVKHLSDPPPGMANAPGTRSGRPAASASTMRRSTCNG
jgi:hypothetical protein